MADAATKTLVIPSNLTDAHEAQVEIMRHVREVGFPEEPGFAVRLALDEALSNAVRHGNKLDPNKKVTIEYRVGPEEVCISVTDEGEGFDPGKVPDPTLDENLDHPNGRGLMLIRAYMSSVSHSLNGRRLTMTKTADCPLPRKK